MLLVDVARRMVGAGRAAAPRRDPAMQIGDAAARLAAGATGGLEHAVLALKTNLMGNPPEERPIVLSRSYQQTMLLERRLYVPLGPLLTTARGLTTMI
jgi:hypothetical protein